MPNKRRPMLNEFDKEGVLTVACRHRTTSRHQAEMRGGWKIKSFWYPISNFEANISVAVAPRAPPPLGERPVALRAVATYQRSSQIEFVQRLCKCVALCPIPCVIRVLHDEYPSRCHGRASRRCEIWPGSLRNDAQLE